MPLDIVYFIRIATQKSAMEDDEDTVKMAERHTNPNEESINGTNTKLN